MLPESRRNDKDITRLTKTKVIDSAYTFNTSKVKAIMSFDVCNALHCFYSKKTVGEINGPRKLQACVLDK